MEVETELTRYIKEKFKDSILREYSNSSITLQNKIGEGSFGTVYHAILTLENNEKADIAYKLIDLEKNFGVKKLDIDIIGDLLNEMYAMTRVKCDRIPPCYGVNTDYVNPVNASKVGLLLGFVEGITLKTWIETNKKKKDDKILLDFSVQLIEIVKTLHENHITHRDIKPDNIMVRPDNKLMLLDFGIAKVSDKTCTKTSLVKGTRRYMPPDAFIEFDDKEGNLIIKVSTKFDIWSVGCIIFELFSRTEPWTGKNATAIERELMRKKVFPFSDKFQKDYPEISILVKECLEPEIQHRIDAKGLLEKINEIIEILEP